VVLRFAESPHSGTVFKVAPLDVNGTGLDNSNLVHMAGSNDQFGRLSPVSASTRRVLWTHDQRAAWVLHLSTVGKQVFAGDLHRYFLALDAGTGNVLCKRPPGPRELLIPSAMRWTGGSILQSLWGEEA